MDDFKLTHLPNQCCECVQHLEAMLKAARDVMEYASHETLCVLTFWEAGEPTPDGGYRTKYAGKWYQTSPVDKTPKCTCGLDELYQKAVGKGL